MRRASRQSSALSSWSPATIVIAAVVMAMLGSFSPPKKTYSVAVSASKTPEGNVTVTFIGGPDASFVKTLKANITDVSYSSHNETIPLTAETGSTNTTKIYTYSNLTHVVVTAEFKDGTKQVVLDTYV